MSRTKYPANTLPFIKKAPTKPSQGPLVSEKQELMALKEEFEQLLQDPEKLKTALAYFEELINTPSQKRNKS